MHLSRRPIFLTLLLAALFICAATVTAASAQVPQPRASAHPTSSISVATCRSNAWYSARELTFRARMSRLDPAVAQRLEVKLEVWRKLDESARYRKLKLTALRGSLRAKDPAATVFERVVSVRNTETAARYRARATFRWRNASTGKLELKRSKWSKVCRQRTKLPKLAITGARTLPAVGSDDVIHLLTVRNSGRSEARRVPVAVYVDGAAPVLGQIDSIGPRQTADVAITTPACKGTARAVIDPLRTLTRLRGSTRVRLPLPTCR